MRLMGPFVLSTWRLFFVHQLLFAFEDVWGVRLGLRLLSPPVPIE